LSGSGGADGLWLQWLEPKLTRKPPGLLSKDPILLTILAAYVYGRTLARLRDEGYGWTNGDAREVEDERCLLSHPELVGRIPLDWSPR
jgi:hypothetical protein